MGRLLMQRMISLTIFMILGINSVNASEAKARMMIQNLGQEAIDKTQSDQQVIEKWFRTTLLEDFDMPAICQFVLRNTWHTATPDQQRQFQDAFVTQLTKLYAQRFQEFSGALFSVERSRQRGQRVIVSSIVRKSPGAPASKVDWVLNSKLKITDVQIEGVSMLITKRQEYTSFLASQGGRTIEDLIHTLTVP